MARIISMLYLIISSVTALSQGNALSVTLSNTHLKIGDTLWLDVHYSVKGKPVPTASVFLVMINENGQVWNMRWPVLDGKAKPGLIIPRDIAPGNYQLHLAARDNFFSLSGQVKSPEGLKMLQAILIAGSGDGIVSNLPVSSQGNFEYNNLLFEDEARLLFSAAKTNPEDLDITIKTELDSVFLPSARILKAFFIGPQSAKPVARLNLDSLFIDTYSLLPTVIVSGSKRPTAETLNKKYASGLFNDINARAFVLSEERNAGSYSLFQYIQRLVPGIIFRYVLAPEPYVTWRNESVTFYLDEMRVDASTANAIPLNDVVMIKVFPPPFFGNFGGSGGAIAIYTNRGDSDKPARHNFTIRGYSPMIAKLPANGSGF